MLAAKQKIKESSSEAGCTVAFCKISYLEEHVSLWIFCPQTYNAGLVFEKNIRQTQIERHSAKCLTSTPQNCHGHELYGKVKQLSQTRAD